MSTLVNDNFNSYTVGSPPPGYTEIQHTGNATWSIQNVTGFGSLAVQAITSTVGEESLVKNGLSLADGWIAADIIIGGAITNEQPGLSLRVVSSNTNVQARLDKYDNVLRIAVTNNGVFTSYDVAYTWAVNTKYHLVVEAQGSTVTASVYSATGTLLVQNSVTNIPVTATGQWGLRAVAGVNGTDYWDNLLIGTFDPWDDLQSTGVVELPHSDLSSTGAVAATGSVAVQYLVNPIGISDLSSTGIVHQSSNLPSTGSISAYGSVAIKYEVIERPKVTVALSPVADAFVIDDKPTMNYGDTDDLVVGRYYSSLARSFLRFDISSLRTDLLIVSAVLRLSARFFENGQVGVYSLFNPWLEYDVTWLNQPGRNIVPESTAAMGQTVDLDITQLFMGWYKQTRANYGVAVALTDESVQAHSVYMSREWPQSSQRPQLLITHYLPAGIPAGDSLSSRGQVIGHTYSDLASTGVVGGGWSDISSAGKVSRSSLISAGIVSQVANLPSTGTIRGLRIANDFSSIGVVSRPFILSSGTPRIHTQNDFSSAGYVYYRYNLPSTGYPRVYGYNNLSSAGYVAHARNELPSTGVVTGYYNDITSSGSVRVASYSNLSSSGYVAHARNELPSLGHVTGPWMRSSGIVAQVNNMYSRGSVRIPLDLPSSGFVTYSGHSDLSGTGLPRIRAVSEIMSYGTVRGGTADLPSRGHVGAWVLRAETTVSTWPPAGRSVG